MQIRPSYDEILGYAEGDYDVVPVSCEILSDICTPIGAMRKLKNVSEHCFMLESVLGSEKWGRYTFLGYDPKLLITACGEQITVGDKTMTTEDPNIQIREVLAQYKSPKIPYLPPFTGGLTGYFSYDYLAYSEKTLTTDVPDTGEFKDVDLMLFDKVIAFDNFRQKKIGRAHV